jgi:hypothetical protein
MSPEGRSHSDGLPSLFCASMVQEEELRTVREVLRAQQAAWEDAGVQVGFASPGTAVTPHEQAAPFIGGGSGGSVVDSL